MFGKNTDFDALKKDVLTPIKDAHNYLKQGMTDEAKRCIETAKKNMLNNSYEMDRDIKEDVQTQIKTEESLLSVKPEDIDPAYELINIRSQYVNLTKRLLDDMEQETSKFKKDTDKFGTEYSNSDISHSVTDYQTKLRDAISSNPVIKEIDEKLKQYGLQQ